MIAHDLDFAKIILWLLSFSPKMKKIQPLMDTALNEFFNWIKHELDYRLEALNMARIKKNFAGVSYFVAPEVCYEASSSRILTMELIEGVSLNELFDQVKDLATVQTVRYKTVRVNKNLFIKHAVRILFKQIFEDGYFHADPHPANILITTEGKIAYIDFGVVGILDPLLRKKMLEIFAGIVNRDAEKITESFIALDEISGHEDFSRIEAKIRKFLYDLQGGTLLEMSAARLFLSLVMIALESKIDLPLPLIVIGKTMLEYDGDLRAFDPKLDLIYAFKPHVEKLYGTKDFSFSPKSIPATIDELLTVAETFPANVQKLIKNLSHDGIELTMRIAPAKITQK